MATSASPTERRSTAAFAVAALVAALVTGLVTSLLAALVGSVAASVNPPATATQVGSQIGSRADMTGVIVRSAPGDVVGARRAFVSAGGTIRTELPIIDGFAGAIDAANISDLTTSPSIAAVTADRSIEAMSVDPLLGYEAKDTSSMSAITRITGAQELWNKGFVGQGIDVALIDTGVTRVPGLDGTGKVLNGPDLSFDSLDPALVSKDAFGHGTHMAGIIAGSDVAPGTSRRTCRSCLGRSAYTDTTKFVGIAPEARIINVKVGAFDGAADVSQVIAAIDWVVQHRNDPGVNIRVLNLSFGTDSTQDADLDPLVFAADQAWKSGIVVVASAGNDGMATTSLATPATSASIIAVGASDPRGTLSTSDDSIPEFAQHGSAERSVDIVAPGVSLIGLRVPGGFIDTNVETGRVGTRFQRASGTSQSTAVVSGLVALLLSRSPDATPDMVKAYLTGTAKPVKWRAENHDRDDSTPARLVPLSDTWYAGAGSAFVGGRRHIRPAAAPAPTSTGLGTLDASRGSYRVTNGDTELNGEMDIFGAPWDPARWTGLSATRSAWSGGIWNDNRWTGDRWGDTGWVNVPWTGIDGSEGDPSHDWSGARWKGVRWKDVIWDGVRWKGAEWTSGLWTSGEWSADGWTAGGWNGVRWKGAAWSDASWS